MRPSARWFVPVAVAGTIIGGSAVSAAVAGSPPDLPARTPAQVLAAVAGSRVSTLSGTVTTHVDIGLPALPSFGGSGGGDGRDGAASTSPQALLTRFLAGDNTIRVWGNGPQQQRAQLLDPFAELDVIHNGSDLWTYSSRQNAVTHTSLPTQARAGSSAGPSTGSQTMAPQQLTPQALAQRFLAQVGPTTAVTVGTPATVAGQDSYSLVLTPRTTATLIDHVVIAVDAANGAPLRVQVYARGHSDAVAESGFTAVSFARPAASIFRFTPPPGASVRQVQPPAHPDHGSAAAGTSGATARRSGGKPSTLEPADTRPSGSATGAADQVRTIGTGWAAIVELPAGAVSPATSGASSAGGAGSAGSGGNGSGTGTAVPGAGGVSVQQLLNQVTTPVSGGRALRTALFSVLITSDGRVLAGAVPVQALIDAAR